MRSSFAAFLALAALLPCAAPAAAQSQATASLTVSATVSSSCVVNSVTAINFGMIDPGSASVQNRIASGSVSITCPSGNPYRVYIPVAAGTTNTTRRMSLGDNTKYISYGLFTDSAGNLPWPTELASAVSRVGTGNEVRIAVVGKITGITVPQGSSLEPGTYSDTVTVTVDF